MLLNHGGTVAQWNTEQKRTKFLTTHTGNFQNSLIFCFPVDLISNGPGEGFAVFLRFPKKSVSIFTSEPSVFSNGRPGTITFPNDAVVTRFLFCCVSQFFSHIISRYIASASVVNFALASKLSFIKAFISMAAVSFTFFIFSFASALISPNFLLLSSAVACTDPFVYTLPSNITDKMVRLY